MISDSLLVVPITTMTQVTFMITILGARTLHYAIAYYGMLYSTTICHTNYTIRYHTVIYYTIPYHTIR